MINISAMTGLKVIIINFTVGDKSMTNISTAIEMKTIIINFAVRDETDDISMSLERK